MTEVVYERLRLARAFFARSALDVAPDLVGKLLVRRDEALVARIVETEAYLQDDPACHAHRGPTRRNAPLFGDPGHAYVYISYGLHWCMNTTTGTAGEGQGVLLRAAEPLAGLERMRARRGGNGRVPDDRELLRGPGRLGQAFGLDGSWSGVDLCSRDDGERGMYVADDGCRPQVATSARTGVSSGADRPWRFYVAGSRWVSPYKRHPQART